MNTYFAAIQQATYNGQFPELSDYWRKDHPNASFSDLTADDFPEESQIEIEFLREQAF